MGPQIEDNQLGGVTVAVDGKIVVENGVMK
jgi:hypothetical protein